MSADRSVMEGRLHAAFRETPSTAGAAVLDARVSAAIAADARAGRGAPAARPRSSWLLSAAAVVALVAIGGGAVAWLWSGHQAGRGNDATAPIAAEFTSPAPTSLASASATPRGSVVASPAPSGSPAPLPVMNAARIVDSIAHAQDPGSWWSPGRLLGRIRQKDQPARGAALVTVSPPEQAELVLEPRPGGIVRVSSRSATAGQPDPLGCAPDSSGRYRIAATADRLDLVPVSDGYDARAAAIAGTWLASDRFTRPSVLWDFRGDPQVEAIRIDMVAAGLTDVLGGGYWGDGRRPVVLSALQLDRPDLVILMGVPNGAAVGACTLSADRADDVPLLSADQALEDLRARPDVEVVAVTDLAVGDHPLMRVDVAAVDEPDACPGRALFAAAPNLDPTQRPLWTIPAPEPGQTTAPVYLATVPGRDGASTAFAIIVAPTADGADPDAIAKQVFGAIDWQPELHPPDWPTGD
ncbi:MAG: hypothetical protein U0869_23940 [Chloroflexota bacterium]